MLGLYLDATIGFFTEQKTRRQNKNERKLRIQQNIGRRRRNPPITRPNSNVGWVLGIVGIVLLAKATKEFSYYYQDESIYKNAWTGLKYLHSRLNRG